MSSVPSHDVGAFHRPPRTFPPAIPNEPVVVACPPARTRRGPGGLIQVLLPVLGSLGIVAFAVVTPNKLFLIVACVFVAIALLSALTSAWIQRRTGKLSARNQRRLYRAHLAEREERLRALAARQRETDERLYPDPVRLVGVAAHRRYLWERRPHDADFLAFRVGHATVPLACPVSLELSEDPMTEYDPELLDAAQELVARLGKVEDLSVVAGIGQADVVTIGRAGSHARPDPLAAGPGGCLPGTCRLAHPRLLLSRAGPGLGLAQMAAAHTLRSWGSRRGDDTTATDGRWP
jgi:S-DNA-T family DNA segregation ATPase FtsK/SpoIIIE